MSREFDRTIKVIGQEGLDRLRSCHVAVFGVGGVGGFAVEALARTGVGALTLVDKDVVDITNLNRQIIGLHSTIGKSKAEVMKARIGDINPECKVTAMEDFFLPENSHTYDFSQYDYVIDAVDTVTAKIELILCTGKTSTPIISSMGMGNKVDPTRIQVGDIYETSVCPLAKILRKELRERGVEKLKVVYSTESPKRQRPPGSVAFVPPAAGLIIAGEVIKELIQWER